MWSVFLLAASLGRAQVPESGPPPLVPAPDPVRPWYTWPLAPSLHPVRLVQTARLEALMVERLSGPSSSPLFRDPLARAQVYYAWLVATGAPLSVDDATMLVWRETAWAGATMALEGWLLETVDRSEGASVTFQVLRTFVSPNLEVKKTEGTWQARVNQGDLSQRRRLRVQEAADGLERRGREQVAPSIRLGSGFQAWEDDFRGRTVTRYDAAIWAQANGFAIQNVALYGYATRQTWELTLRDPVWQGPGLSASMVLTSREKSAIPGTWGAGLSLNPPGWSPWTVFARFRQDVPIPPFRGDEWRVDLTLRYLPRNPVVSGPGRWPPGQETDRPWPWWTRWEGGRPNVLRRSPSPRSVNVP